MDIEGGCLCGAVRYRATVEQAAATVCHCRDCQKFTGSAFAALLAVPKETLMIEGAMTTFSSLGGSGRPILRHFCPRCGPSLAEESSGRPGMLILNIGTFDDPSQATPGREIFCDDALSWVHVVGDVPQFAKRPT